MTRKRRSSRACASAISRRRRSSRRRRPAPRIRERAARERVEGIGEICGLVRTGSKSVSEAHFAPVDAWIHVYEPITHREAVDPSTRAWPAAIALALLAAPTASAATTGTVALTNAIGSLQMRTTKVASRGSEAGWRLPAYRLTIHDLRTGAPVCRPPPATTCAGDPLAGTRAAVRSSRITTVEMTATGPSTIALQDRRVRSVGEFWDITTPLGGIAGDGATLAFAEAWDGAQVWRLAGHPRGGRRRHGGLLLAASSGRIAAGPGDSWDTQRNVRRPIAPSRLQARSRRSRSTAAWLCCSKGRAAASASSATTRGPARSSPPSISRAAAAELDIASNRSSCTGRRSDGSYTPPAPSASS